MNNNNKKDAVLQADTEDNLRRLFHKFVTMRKIFNMISLKKIHSLLVERNRHVKQYTFTFSDVSVTDQIQE